MIPRLTPCPDCGSTEVVFVTGSTRRCECGWFGKCLQCRFWSSPSASIVTARDNWKMGVRMERDSSVTEVQKVEEVAESKRECASCGARSSVIWWPFSLIPIAKGVVCDRCQREIVWAMNRRRSEQWR